MTAYLFGAIPGAFTFGKKGGKRSRFMTHFMFLSVLLSAIALCCGSNLAQQTEASGPPTVGVPGDTAFGTLQQGYLEASNVDEGLIPVYSNALALRNGLLPPPPLTFIVNEDEGVIFFA